MVWTRMLREKIHRNYTSISYIIIIIIITIIIIIMIIIIIGERVVSDPPRFYFSFSPASQRHKEASLWRRETQRALITDSQGCQTLFVDWRQNIRVDYIMITRNSGCNKGSVKWREVGEIPDRGKTPLSRSIASGELGGGGGAEGTLSSSQLVFTKP